MKKLSYLLLVLLAMAALQLNGQQTPKKITITGKVTDGAGNPVYGAVILVDEVTTEVTTDQNGNYRLRIKPDAKVISAFSLGKGMADAQVNGRTTVDIKLPGKSTGNQTQAAPKDESVNIGYGSVEKSELNNTVGKIDATNSKYASYTNIYDMIRGEVPGVQVIGNRITIHGVSSINSGTDPLLIVDGMSVSSIDDIRPQTVKSIEILKGSAASIYGSRGTNGVILITLLGAEKKK
jgi:TonB-dependent SusC/RagA subfamily outer membrane receptor